MIEETSPALLERSLQWQQVQDHYCYCMLIKNCVAVFHCNPYFILREQLCLGTQLMAGMEALTSFWVSESDSLRIAKWSAISGQSLLWDDWIYFCQATLIVMPSLWATSNIGVVCSALAGFTNSHMCWMLFKIVYKHLFYEPCNFMYISCTLPLTKWIGN